MNFHFRDYWPQPKVGELAVFDFGKGADDKPYSWITWNSGDSKTFYQEDYHDNKWTSTWVMNYYHPRGVLEVADIYPRYPYQFWTKYRTTAFAPGKEIFWGGQQKIGDEFTVDLLIDPVKSTKVELPTPGKQHVAFVKHYPIGTAVDGSKKYNDVIEVIYDQTFGSKTAGWRAWHAKGIGIFQLSWRYNGKDIGSVYVGNVVTKKGYIKDKYPVLTS